MALIKQEILAFRKRAQSIKAIIMIGNEGLSAGVHAEIDRALDHHGLLKIKVAGVDRDELPLVAKKITDKHHAELIQIIGKTVVIFRKIPEKKVAAEPEYKTRATKPTRRPVVRKTATAAKPSRSSSTRSPEKKTSYRTETLFKSAGKADRVKPTRAASGRKTATRTTAKPGRTKSTRSARRSP